jgi:hypothetical protein
LTQAQAKRIYGQQVDPGTGAVVAIRAATAQAGTKRLDEAHQSEIVGLHFVACRENSLALHGRPGSHVLCRINKYIGLAADFAGQLVHRNRVGDVERHNFDTGNFRQLVAARVWPPILGNADENF